MVLQVFVNMTFIHSCVFMPSSLPAVLLDLTSPWGIYRFTDFPAARQIVMAVK
jgi:hypothetical protein